MHDSSEPIHFVAPGNLIQCARKLLDDNKLAGKIVKKDGEAHIFLNIDKNLLKCVNLGPAWEPCSNCNLCKSPSKTTKISKFVIYPPMILLPTNTNTSKVDLEAYAQDLLKQHTDCTHVAVNSVIKSGDRIRRPRIQPLIGEFGEFEDVEEPNRRQFDNAFWATSLQNGIFQTWAPLYTMFSRGNITEKKRVLDTFAEQASIVDTTVIDLYCGIGYFVFPYAKQRPKVIYCWELNWWSVEGLLRAAKHNNFNARAIFQGDKYTPEPTDHIIVFVEDNQNALKRLKGLDLNVSHINMGLLPDARAAIPIAVELASRSQGQTIIHLHENVKSTELENWKLEIEAISRFSLVHLEKIKQYSPGVWHVCGDFLSSKAHNT